MPDWSGYHKFGCFPAAAFLLRAPRLAVRTMLNLTRPIPTPGKLFRAAAFATPGAAFAITVAVRARAQRVPVVRDAEIEALVREYARPIFKAANLSSSGIRIILVNDPSFNA